MAIKMLRAAGERQEDDLRSPTSAIRGKIIQCPTCLGQKTVEVEGKACQCFRCRGAGTVVFQGYQVK